MFGEWFSRIRGKVEKWYHGYIFFSKAVPFIFGLIVSQSMINKAVVGMLIAYLTFTWLMDSSKDSIEEYYLPSAATIVNLLAGITTVSAVIVAYIADSYLKRFTTIVICALAYTMVIPHSFLV
nr:hypothetical protein CFP56_50672 [Quercus suber]